MKWWASLAPSTPQYKKNQHARLFFSWVYVSDLLFFVCDFLSILLLPQCFIVAET
jgi:hypothetical protein